MVDRGTDHATLSDINFEARKTGLRQDKDGEFVVSFKIHPDDLPTILLKAPYGTRYQVGMIEMGDDEKPVNRRPELTTIDSAAPEIPTPNPSKDPDQIEAARRRYRSATDAERAIADAHIYAKDKRFWEWATMVTSKWIVSEADALAWIHAKCRVDTCRQFRVSAEALRAFDQCIRMPYLTAINRIAERRT